MQYIIWIVIISTVLVVINFISAAYMNKSAKSSKEEDVLIEEAVPENYPIHSEIIAEPIEKEEEVTDRDGEKKRNKEISKNIQYSKQIQQSVNRDKEKLAEFVPESFILFKPKDQIGGDFYWFKNVTFTKGVADEYGDIQNEEYTVLLLASVDCKSLEIYEKFSNSIDTLLINQSEYSPGINSLSDKLNTVRSELKDALSKKTDEILIPSVMDISLCAIDFNSMKLNFTSTNNPLYVIRGGDVIEIKSKYGEINAFSNNQFLPIINQTFDLQKQDCIYLLTDGFANQFGGKEGKKIMLKGLKEALLSLQGNDMEEQKIMLHKTFEFWKGALEQEDNVLIIGVKI